MWIDNVLQKACKVCNFSRHRQGERNKMMIKSYIFTCHVKVVGKNKRDAWKILQKSIHLIKRRDFRLTKIDWTPSANQIIKYLSNKRKGISVTTSLSTGKRGKENLSELSGEKQ